MEKKNAGTDSLPFAGILASVMKERNLSLQQLAALAAVSKSVVQSWLSGANPHDLAAVNRLAKGLGIGFKTLLLGEAEEVVGPQSVAEMFEKVPLFEGMCEISIKKLVPRK